MGQKKHGEMSAGQGQPSEYFLKKGRDFCYNVNRKAN